MDAEGALWFFTDLRSELAERLRAVNLSFVRRCPRHLRLDLRPRRDRQGSGAHRASLDLVRPRRFSRRAELASPGAAQGGGGKGRVLGCAQQPDRPPARARRLGRRRHADRPGRSRRPDRPVARRSRGAPSPLDEESARGLAGGRSLAAGDPRARRGAGGRGPGLRVDRLAVPGLAGARPAGARTRPPGRVQRRGGRPERRARRAARVACASRRSGSRSARRRGARSRTRCWRATPACAWATSTCGGPGAASRCGSGRSMRASSTPRSSAVPTAGPRGSSARAAASGAETQGATSLPNFAKLRVGKGRLTYADEVLAGFDRGLIRPERRQRAGRGRRSRPAVRPTPGASSCAPAARPRVLRRRLRRSALAPGERGLRLNAFGQYRKLPARIEAAHQPASSACSWRARRRRPSRCA